jgi:glycosyltransferase involved in cell wall biosynthesis
VSESPAKLKNLSIILPAYNEQDNIYITVEKAFQLIPGFAENFEVIVINDGSKDNTQKCLEVLSQKYNNFKVVTHQANQGYGAALKSGFKNCRYDYVFYTDGDGQFDINEIEKLISLLGSCDIAAGYRCARSDGLHRRLNAFAYNLFVNILFGLNVKDIDCAFKLIRKRVFEAIELKSSGAFLSAELLIRAKKKGFRIKQCGVNHLPRQKGSSTGDKLHVIIKAFKELFKLWKELKP